MEEYVFHLAQSEPSRYFWLALLVIAVAWPIALWRLAPLTRRAVRQRQLGVAAAAIVLGLCPFLLTPTVVAKLYEQSLAIHLRPREVVEHSLFGTHRITLERPLRAVRSPTQVLVSDGRDRIRLPAGRWWRLQYPFLSTEELVSEVLARSRPNK